MGSTEEEVYAVFKEKVRRTVYLDNLSPMATAAVVRTALDQFGNVKNVHFIPNYLEHKNIPQSALVEMGEQKEAEAVISLMAENPFMISGMPRPVRARAAEVEMFDERPKEPGRKITCRWLDRSDPDVEVARKMKLLVKQHASEVDFMLKKQLEQELKLHNQQLENLKTNYQKFDMVDSFVSDGIPHRLARHYSLKFTGD